MSDSVKNMNQFSPANNVTSGYIICCIFLTQNETITVISGTVKDSQTTQSTINIEMLVHDSKQTTIKTK